MKYLRTLIVAACVLSLAGAAVAAEIHDISKIPVDKPGAPGIMATQGMLDCSGAIDVDLGVGVYYGTTVGAPNNVSTYSCSAWNEGGGEVVYRVTFPADVIWEVGLTDLTVDLDLAVLDQCDESLGCLIVVNSGVYVEEPLPGEFYFVVDGYGTANGSYTLTFTTYPFTPPPPPPPFCEFLQEGTGTQFMGDTCDGQNLVSEMACGNYTENGLEHYYEIQVPAGCYFTADVTYATKDGALWLMDSCEEGYACIGYADATFTGETETVTYTNTSGADQIVYLVLDAYGTASCGAYVFDFTTDCAVATENESFGGVKAMFR